MTSNEHPQRAINRTRKLREAHARDFGRMHQRMPSGVAIPRTPEDVKTIVRWAARENTQLAIQGGRHSQGGQSLVEDGIVLSTCALNRVERPDTETIRAQGGATWGKVVDALQGTRRLPAVLADIAEVSVGGTLSAGGLGTTSHHYGIQVQQVDRLEVVTGEGEIVRCSPNENRDLFDAVRAGQGQFGLITEATVRLRLARPRLRQYDLHYRDPEKFAHDLALLVDEHRFDHLRAEFRLDGGEIILNAGLEHDGAVDEATLLRNLGHALCEDAGDTPNTGRALMFPAEFFDWHNCHPWRDWFLPWPALKRLVTDPDLHPTTVPARTASWIGLYPLAIKPRDAPLLMRPKGRMTISYHILCGWNDPARATKLAAELEGIDRRLVALGGKSYLSGGAAYDTAKWTEHYGPLLAKAAEWKRRFDPHNVFPSNALPHPNPTTRHHWRKTASKRAESLPSKGHQATSIRSETLPALCWSVRRQGVLVAESDPNEPDTQRTLDALQAVASRPGDIFVVSELNWCDPLPRDTWLEHLGPEHQGTIALAFVTEHRCSVVTPDHTIATNESYPEALHRYLEQGIGARSFEIRFAETKTKLVRTGDPALETEIHRGTNLVPLEPDPGENRALTIATGIAMWFANNVDAAGRLPYLWNTSEENPDHSSDNAIRRFLGSIALGRFAMHQGDETLNDAYRRNLTHLLDTYLQPLGDGMAIIAEKCAANLGASSVAGLAILAGPEEDQDRQALSMLLRAVSSMTHERRGFRTYFYPTERDGQGWEFYSGEALLFVCEAARLKIPDAPTEDELFVLYRRCRDRWRERRHVAFISWHSQALTSLYQIRASRELANFVLEMSDWLIELQPQTSAEPDRLGEFGDPLRRDHGTPHASSTGVYLEGLADARDVARAMGDTARQERYEHTITLALRSLRQLQFRDWRCTWYLENPEAVLGALRSNVNDNRVWIDNCGHALAGLVKLLSPLTLPEPVSPTDPREPKT